MATINAPSTVVSGEFELAAMLIESNYQQSEANREAAENARIAQTKAMREELEAIEDQADAERTGAILQGGLTIASAGLSVGAAVTAPTCRNVQPHDTSNYFSIGAGAANDLAKPFGNYFGAAAKTDAQRDAQAAEQAQQQAAWSAEDAQDQRDKLAKRSEQLLQQVQSLVEGEHSATIAVLSNF